MKGHDVLGVLDDGGKIREYVRSYRLRGRTLRTECRLSWWGKARWYRVSCPWVWEESTH